MTQNNCDCGQDYCGMTSMSASELMPGSSASQGVAQICLMPPCAPELKGMSGVSDSVVSQIWSGYYGAYVAYVRAHDGEQGPDDFSEVSSKLSKSASRRMRRAALRRARGDVRSVVDDEVKVVAGFCYLRAVVPSQAECVQQMIGCNPTIGSLLQEPRDCFVSAGELASLHVSMAPGRAMLHVEDGGSLALIDVVGWVSRRLDPSTLPEGSFGAWAISECCGVFDDSHVRMIDDSWRIGMDDTPSANPYDDGFCYLHLVRPEYYDEALNLLGRDPTVMKLLELPSAYLVNDRTIGSLMVSSEETSLRLHVMSPKQEGRGTYLLPVLMAAMGKIDKSAFGVDSLAQRLYRVPCAGRAYHHFFSGIDGSWRVGSVSSDVPAVGCDLDAVYGADSCYLHLVKPEFRADAWATLGPAPQLLQLDELCLDWYESCEPLSVLRITESCGAYHIGTEGEMLLDVLGHFSTTEASRLRDGGYLKSIASWFDDRYTFENAIELTSGSRFGRSFASESTELHPEFAWYADFSVIHPGVPVEEIRYIVARPAYAQFDTSSGGTIVSRESVEKRSKGKTQGYRLTGNFEQQHFLVLHPGSKYDWFLPLPRFTVVRLACCVDFKIEVPFGKAPLVWNWPSGRIEARDAQVTFAALIGAPLDNTRLLAGACKEIGPTVPIAESTSVDCYGLAISRYRVVLPANGVADVALPCRERGLLALYSVEANAAVTVRFSSIQFVTDSRRKVDVLPVATTVKEGDTVAVVLIGGADVVVQVTVLTLDDEYKLSGGGSSPTVGALAAVEDDDFSDA